MKNYIGIDLGTTNSAICSYDGENTRIWKSPEQNDVTPSTIYFDRRGKKFVGQRAYDLAPLDPSNAASLFKRFMGTKTPITFASAGLTWTPEECSAEILKALYGCLNEELRTNNEGTVITVPAAFNQMQKDATMQAAELANIGRVALMQEPVAAVMSVMRTRKRNGKFLIYDLGGGTFDIALAESTDGRVNLLAHGGIAMCGGRDMDRALWENVMRPRLLENFHFPEDFSVAEEYKRLIRMGIRATERAKIELSAREKVDAILTEIDAMTVDLDGQEIYLAVPIDRQIYDRLIETQVDSTIKETRKLLESTGITASDVDCIVFVGGPTNYKPLRERVALALAIEPNLDVNPMTAVAEGASIFSESIDWDSKNRGRKKTRGQIQSDSTLALNFNYISRTPALQAKIAVQLPVSPGVGWEFQIDGLDTGWTSGKLALQHGTIVIVNLVKNGENRFRTKVFDPAGKPIPLEDDTIVIVRTASAVGAIPASRSISIEVLDKIGGRPILKRLVNAGDALPKKGKLILKAAETLKSGSPSSLNFKLWEGEIEDRITDNRLIGSFRVNGTDFDDGVISAGESMEFHYEILDSGQMSVQVSIPCIRADFDSCGKNFYSRQIGEEDYSSEAVRAEIAAEEERLREDLDSIASRVDDEKINEVRAQLREVQNLNFEEEDAEKTKRAAEHLHEAKILMADIRKQHLSYFRQSALDDAIRLFNANLRETAKPGEEENFDKLAYTAQKDINNNDSDFEGHLNDLRQIIANILWRQPWFIIDQFKYFEKNPNLFTDRVLYDSLCSQGRRYVAAGNTEELEKILTKLYTIKKSTASVEEMCDVANIILG